MLNIANSIVASDVTETTQVVANIFRGLEISNVVTVQDADNAMSVLDRFPTAPLVIDWSLGQKAVAQILSFNRRRHREVERPILLICKAVDPTVVATAAEYFVREIFSQQVSPMTIAPAISVLLHGDPLNNSVRRELLSALACRDKGDLKTALSELQATYSRHSTIVRIRCELAETLIQMGDYPRAKQILTGIEQQKPIHVRAIHLLGRALMHLKEFEEAHRVLELVQLFNPYDAERLCDLGEVLMHRDRIEEATEHFEAALKLAPDSAPAKLGLATAMLVDERINEGLKIINDVTSDGEKAALFNTAAVMNMQQGRYDVGLRLYHAALKVCGKKKLIAAKLFFNLGLGYRRASKPNEAKEYFLKALKTNPKYEKAKKQIDLIEGKPTKSSRPKGPTSPDAVSELMNEIGDLVNFDTIDPKTDDKDDGFTDFDDATLMKL